MSIYSDAAARKIDSPERPNVREENSMSAIADLPVIETIHMNTLANSLFTDALAQIAQELRLQRLLVIEKISEGVGYFFGLFNFIDIFRHLRASNGPFIFEDCIAKSFIRVK